MITEPSPGHTLEETSPDLRFDGVAESVSPHQLTSFRRLFFHFMQFARNPFDDIQKNQEKKKRKPNITKKS